MDDEKWGWNSLDSKIPASLLQPRRLQVWNECSVLHVATRTLHKEHQSCPDLRQTSEDGTDRTSKAQTKDGKTEIIMIYPSLKEGPIQFSSHVHTKWELWSMCWAISKPLIKQINPINFKSKSGRKAPPSSEMFSVIVAACFLHYCISNSM